MKFSHIPNHEQVILKTPKVEDKSAGGIHLSEEAKMKAQKSLSRGTVMAKGRDCSFVSPDDYVAFYRNAATEMEIDGVEYMVINEEHILAILIGLEESKETVTL